MRVAFFLIFSTLYIIPVISQSPNEILEEYLLDCFYQKEPAVNVSEHMNQCMTGKTYPFYAFKDLQGSCYDSNYNSDDYVVLSYSKENCSRCEQELSFLKNQKFNKAQLKIFLISEMKTREVNHAHLKHVLYGDADFIYKNQYGYPLTILLGPCNKIIGFYFRGVSYSMDTQNDFINNVRSN